ncbi:MAG: hypothetical protein JW913_16930 [Chitinispirillaceae bacterium]|nr:hypothetical protein [Chitinispirillaceae bacterium]
MMIGSVTVSAGSYGYPPGECSSCNNARAAAGAEEQQKAPAGRVPSSGSTEELTPEEQKQVAELKRRDREVKAHEAAHIAAGGGYVGGAQFSYQSGPDGKRYAVGGEVSIDTSPVNDNPEATIRKMQTVRRAALAPADPSGQDRAVAAAASAQEAQARQELSVEQTAEARGDNRKHAVTLHRGYSSDAQVQTGETAVAQLDMIA